MDNKTMLATKQTNGKNWQVFRLFLYTFPFLLPLAPNNSKHEHWLLSIWIRFLIRWNRRMWRRSQRKYYRHSVARLFSSEFPQATTVFFAHGLQNNINSIERYLICVLYASNVLIAHSMKFPTYLAEIIFDEILE